MTSPRSDLASTTASPSGQPRFQRQPSSTASDRRPDGRKERGSRNKSSVVSALLELYAIGELNPSAARIAEIAGVSERSVFRYFDDMDDLASAAVEVQWERVMPIYSDLVASGTFAERSKAIVDHRLRLYDTIAGAFKASIFSAVRRPSVALAVEQRRHYLRKQAIEQFRSEIESRTDAVVLRSIVDFTLSLENIDYLKNSSGLSQSKVRDVLMTAIAFALRS